MTEYLKNISFGVHLTFTDNFRAMLEKPIIFNQNNIIKLNGMNLFKLNILVDEFSKQIEKLLNKGIKISHIDTHHHIQRYPLVLLAVMQAAKKYNITKIRTQKILNNRVWYNKFYRYLHHSIVENRGFIQPTYYTDFDTFLKSDISFSNNSTFEIMCHPGSLYNDEKYFNDEIYSKISHYLINYDELTKE